MVKRVPALQPARGPVALGDGQFSLFVFNPRFMHQYVSFTLSAAARVDVRIAPTGQTDYVRTINLGVRPAGTISVEWNGLDNAHRRVPEGDYTYTISAVDGMKRVRSESYSILGVTYKRIVVSLSKQTLTAYDGSQTMLTSLVTTGNAALPTPLGHFPILARYTPFTFVSPWPVGSQYYYAPSPTNFALLFDNRGYYVHDAPWRGNYGPGSNATLGTPGQDYTGTHGCVNVPYAAMQQLFNWVTIGTIVDVVA